MKYLTIPWVYSQVIKKDKCWRCGSNSWKSKKLYIQTNTNTYHLSNEKTEVEVNTLLSVKMSFHYGAFNKWRMMKMIQITCIRGTITGFVFKGTDSEIRQSIIGIFIYCYCCTVPFVDDITCCIRVCKIFYRWSFRNRKEKKRKTRERDEKRENRKKY